MFTDQSDGRRSLLLSVRQKRTWNSGMEKWWGSGVTHSAHALKRPARTHLGQIMGRVVTVYIPSCHPCGLKNPSKHIQDRLLLGLVLLFGEIRSAEKDTSSSEEIRPSRGSTVHMAKGWRCVYTQPMLFHTRVHPSSRVSLIVCPPLPLFTRRKLTS